MSSKNIGATMPHAGQGPLSPPLRPPVRKPPHDVCRADRTGAHAAGPGKAGSCPLCQGVIGGHMAGSTRRRGPGERLACGHRAAGIALRLGGRFGQARGKGRKRGETWALRATRARRKGAAGGPGLDACDTRWAAEAGQGGGFLPPAGCCMAWRGRRAGNQRASKKKNLDDLIQVLSVLLARPPRFERGAFSSGG